MYKNKQTNYNEHKLIKLLKNRLQQTQANWIVKNRLQQTQANWITKPIYVYNKRKIKQIVCIKLIHHMQFLKSGYMVSNKCIKTPNRLSHVSNRDNMKNKMCTLHATVTDTWRWWLRNLGGFTLNKWDAFSALKLE